MKKVNICLTILNTIEVEDNITEYEIETKVYDYVNDIDYYLSSGAINDIEWEIDK
jgi:uncharacterized protein (DUF1499 family)